jgi:hypothetical protein
MLNPNMRKLIMHIIKILRSVGIGAVITFVLASIVYYASCYLPNEELILTSNDKFLLTLVLIGILILTIILILLLGKVEKLERFIRDIYNDICDIEDNNSRSHMTTQNMIMKLYKKLGEMNIEKK